MRIQHGTDFTEDTNNHPFVYLQKYKNFVERTEKKSLVYFISENGITCVGSLWKAKIINLLQLLHPPLDAKANRLSQPDEEKFLNTLVRHIEASKLADRILQPENFAIFKATPKSSTIASFGTYYLDLTSATEDQLFKNLHGKHRNVVRSAEANGVLIKFGKDCILDFYSLFEQTMKRSSLFCEPLSYFKDMFSYMEGNILCAVAYYDEIPQGALFMPFTHYGAYYLYGASAEKMEVNGAMNYLHWEAIKWLKKQQVRRYDFVGARLSDVTGTKLHGIQQFKERFGSSLEKGFLWKMDVNPNRCTAFDLLLKVKTKLNKTQMPFDIIDQENLKRAN